MKTMRLITGVVLAGAFFATALPSLAQCVMTGNIESAMTSDPNLPAYEYTLTVEWEMGSGHGLSHLDLVVDLLGGTCDCSDFENAIMFSEIAGQSDGEDDCTVNYMAELECSGDPSIPEVDGILFKFEPIEEEDCEPGAMGTGSFVFYSDLPPVPVDEEFLALIDKGGQESCTGSITGVFPGMACDPVSNIPKTLNSMKSLFR